MIHQAVTPRATEKAYRLITAENTYIFDVPLELNKQQIIQLVESQYDGVKVASIKVMVQSGKSVRYSRGKNRYPGTTHRKDQKKAYVRLSEGSIKVFDTEEPAKDDKKSKKAEENK